MHVFLSYPGAAENYLNSYLFPTYKLSHNEFISSPTAPYFHHHVDSCYKPYVVYIDNANVERYVQRLFFVKHLYSREGNVPQMSKRDIYIFFKWRFKRYNVVMNNMHKIFQNKHINKIITLSYYDIFVLNKLTGTHLDDHIEEHKIYHRNNIELLYKFKRDTGIDFTKCIPS